MEKNANYALVGIATLVLFVGMVVFAFWIARLQFNRDYDIYDILFVGPVRGLSEGGEVHFNGIKVGEVTKISLDQHDTNRVIARVRMGSDVPVREDSYATLEPQGITGVNYVQITAGDGGRKLLKEIAPPGEVPVIHSRRDTLSDLLQGGGTVLSRSIEALDRMNRVLSDDNIKRFSATMSDIQAITAEARQRKQIFADAQKALASIDTAATEIAELSRTTRGVVDGDGRRSLVELASAAEELKAAAKDARATIAKLDAPASDFATTGLPQLTRAIASLQSTAESLDRLANDVEQNPQGVIGKPPALEREVRP